MRVEFDERFRLTAAEVFTYFQTPADWPRLYGRMGDVEDLGGGWYAIPLRGFAFPLVARNAVVEPLRRVQWIFRGFWKGGGSIEFTEIDDGVRVCGYEQVSVRWLGPLSIVVEKLLLQRTFRAIWRSGWKRLARQAEAGRRDSSMSSRGSALS